MRLPVYREHKNGGTPWLASIPEHWETRRLKFMADVCNGRDQKEVLDEDGAYDVYGSGGVFGKSSEFLYDKVSILLGRKGTIDKPLFIDKPFWTVDTMFYTRIAEEVHPKFFFYLCLTIPFDYHRDQTTLPSMTQSGLSDVRFAFPPPEEQQQIAAFLDWKMEQIDVLIGKKKELLEKLKEKRIAVIAQAVTRGLNTAAPLHDSGIPWLGQVPQHWEVKRLKWAVMLQRGHDLPEVDRVDGNIPIVSSSGISGYHDTFAAKAPGIVTGRYGTIGVFHLIDENYWPLNTTLYSIDLYGNEPRFLRHMLEHISQLFLLNSIKSAVPGVDRNDVLSLAVAIPTLDEQVAIADHVDEELTRLGLFEEQVQLAIDRLTEYRIALITTATTGKIDVRNVKIPEPVA